jgi:TP901 family phage tail tape measure protein
MGNVVRTVSVALKMQVADFVAGGAKGVATMKALGAETDNLAKTSKAKFNDITRVSLGIGAALVAVAGYAVKAGYDFDRQMSEVQAVSGATAGELGKLRDAAITAGKDTQYSATEAAKAEAELSKAGIGSADILGGALKGSLALAAAGQMDLADAATISAQTMKIFGLQGTAVTHIADVLASSSNASAADMHGLG